MTDVQAMLDEEDVAAVQAEMERLREELEQAKANEDWALRQLLGPDGIPRLQAAEAKLARVDQVVDQHNPDNPCWPLQRDLRRVLDGSEKTSRITIRNNLACGCVMDGGMRLVTACAEHRTLDGADE